MVAKPNGAQIRCLSDVAPQEVGFLWDGRIPKGKLCEIVGDPGCGKSTLIAQIAGKLTNGRPLPGETATRAPTNVLILSAEDGVADTIVPRLVSAEADMKRVHVLDGIWENKKFQLFNLKEKSHLKYLHKQIKELEIGLVVIDPLNAYLGGVDSHKDSEVRGLLTPLFKLAEDTGVTVLTIRHMNKSSADKAIYRAGGSIGFTGAVRSSLLVGQTDEDTDERAIVVIKSNLAQFPPPVGFSITKKGFQWSGKTPDVTSADILSPDSSSEDRTDRADTREWLKDLLANGEVPSAEVFEKAKAELSVSVSTVKRAKASMKGTEWEIEAYRESVGRDGKGQWIWGLSARGSNTSDPLGDSESEPLAKQLANKGLPADREPNGLQEGHGQGSDPLATKIELAEDEEYLLAEREGMAN